MNTNEALELERAIHQIQLILQSRYRDHEYTPWAGPTGLGELPPTDKEMAIHMVEAANEASRERVATHFVLTSSTILLGVAQRLMSAPSYLSPKDRAARMRQLTDDLRTGARTAYRAGLMLLDVDPCLPPSADGAKSSNA
ncbi:hypothetical protein QTH91_15905 [Variovorax dokdonensis]|uniref:Uncharacterized protein n=1 Tax=Variovorax dokdonensis TaxID=344883 RepID=A0ABT7NDF3_9BURK|nr:hypothetical protein [Variovorax dokdonensis]MDM0045973.1 hypothetical protein [Variovorax dokdonensis]